MHLMDGAAGIIGISLIFFSSFSKLLFEKLLRRSFVFCHAKLMCFCDSSSEKMDKKMKWCMPSHTKMKMYATMLKGTNVYYMTVLSEYCVHGVQIESLLYFCTCISFWWRKSFPFVFKEFAYIFFFVQQLDKNDSSTLMMIARIKIKMEQSYHGRLSNEMIQWLHERNKCKLKWHIYCYEYWITLNNENLKHVHVIRWVTIYRQMFFQHLSYLCCSILWFRAFFVSFESNL